MNENNYIRLFANCIIVRGYTRSLICDLQKERSHFIPNNLHEISLLFDTHTIAEIKALYNAESLPYIEEYISYLLKHELAFCCTAEELELFPPLSMEWDYPAHVSNAIIDIDAESDFDFHDLFLQLETLGCRDVQLRIYDPVPLAEIEVILSGAEKRTVKSIHVYVPFDPQAQEADYLALVEKYPRITGLFLFAADENRILLPSKAPALTIAKIRHKLHHSTHCGIIDELYFATTPELFTESQHHNTCLNRKIGIDVRGMIKNCPSMSESYGNIRDTRLEEALEKEGFKKYWNIRKDDIAVCQDCEFRHICTDCRAYLEDPADLHSKPLKCGYDPYTTTWATWSNHPLKQKAIAHYNL